jgi:hypothetical protein
MNNIAVHMRISGVTVSDDDVNSRRTAATSLATSWGKETNVSKIVSKAADVAEALGGDGNPSPALGDEVQAAIQKKSSSFLYEERPLDVSVCAGMAMVSILSGSPSNTGWLIVDVYAAALWSALAYQPVLETERRENLRREVLDAAGDWATISAEKARERVSVPDPVAVEIVIGEDKAVTNNFKEATTNTVDALRRNAALDREELDFLWWAQLGRSRLLNRQLSAIAEPTRIVAAGIEGAKMLRRLPCEVHREIVLRTLDQDPALDLAEVLAAVGDDRGPLCVGLVKANVTAHPSVFPLLHALTTGEVDQSGAAVKRPLSEWGARALLETGFARFMSQGAGKV